MYSPPEGYRAKVEKQDMLGAIKNKIVESLERLGLFCEFTLEVFKWTFRRPNRYHLLTAHVEHMGVASVPIIMLSSFAVGMIISLQLVDVLGMFRAEPLAGSAVGITMARELAPVMTALMLIAKNGSAITAEVGTMRISEQIDAMETMSVHPIQYLVVPRVWAAVIVFPILTALANVVGIFGSYIISVYYKSVDKASYVFELYRMVNPKDVYSGLIKSVALGLLVGLISCFYGYYVKGGAKAVGNAATRSVVTSSVGILIADFVMTDIILKIMF
jgi:phospholipid/cholesterol/gamma-HCH transport system permease protein